MERKASTGEMKLTGRIEELLMRVEKPAAYMGGELHSYDKEEESVDLNFGFCFPDTYEIGMSYLGLQIIYHVLNERENIFCQRFLRRRRIWNG